MKTLCPFIIALAIAGGAPMRADSVPGSKPNIVFILADDLGINDLHCYARPRHHTPHLDQMAREGTLFSSAYCAQPICSPSRAAILTGKNPARLHLTTYLPGRADCPSQRLLQAPIRMEVPLEEKLLSEYLKEAGYATACIGKWHVGGKGFGPIEQGFDLYHPGRANTVPSADEGGKGEYDLGAAAERFIEEHRAGPFFVYLAHNSPHIPYTAQQWRVAQNARAYEPVYAAVIETLDDTVGRLLARIEALGLARNTIVVFTSDNGGLHVPEGPHARVTHNRPFRAGKGYLYEGGLRIPLIVRWPGKIPAGRIVDAPVVNTDWLPTLLELAGLDAPRAIDGTSVAPLLLGGDPAPGRRFFWHFPHYNNQGGRPAGAVRDGDWMLIEFYDVPKAELYDLRSDFAERHNLAEQEPDRVRMLRGALEQWRGLMGAQRNAPNPQFDPARFRELYVETDPSRFEPHTASPAEHERMQQWRAAMNSVLPAGGKGKGKGKAE